MSASTPETDIGGSKRKWTPHEVEKISFDLMVDPSNSNRDLATQRWSELIVPMKRDGTWRRPGELSSAYAAGRWSNHAWNGLAHRAQFVL